MLICFLDLENPGLYCFIHLNEINTLKVIVRNGFKHNGGSSFAYLVCLFVLDP